MRKLIATISILGLGTISAQEIHSTQVPSVILNHFQKSFPKALDIEWEIKAPFYEVEFETGYWGDDHKILYSKEGRIVKHVEEISKNNLPKNVLNSIHKNFLNYKIDDAKKIYENGKVFYKTELKNHSKEWKVLFDLQGRVLQKIED